MQLFISDLHLTPERPEAVSLFRRFIDGLATQATSLYILGDFFEVWIGDDDLDLPFHADIAGTLRRLTTAGVAVYFMPGNRDFLAGPRLAEATGWTPLDDPTCIQVQGKPTLISHGDIYCTDDVAYQSFRHEVRTPAWQSAFLAKPAAERRAIAQAIRERSERTKAGTRPEIMDVNAAAIHAACQQHGVTRLIHGHTHRPARHLFEINGLPCERWVLPDWYDQGGYLVCDDSGCRLEVLNQ